ncbi:MAG: Arsenical resistance operon trans-acting repressor ArsD [Anaerocolumna sp.]|nr:Arsenical resistance operon trans-acting repressor ArsD [Anaerocolumna sp.]
MKRMQIFEPAMCCSTGLCGVSVDPELLRISTVLNRLENKGVKVERYNLSSNPQEFVSNKTINDFLKEKGVDALPAAIVDDEVVITGRYPSNEEFVQILGIPTEYIVEQRRTIKAKVKKSTGCGCSDGKCC